MSIVVIYLTLIMSQFFCCYQDVVNRNKFSSITNLVILEAYSIYVKLALGF